MRLPRRPFVLLALLSLPTACAGPSAGVGPAAGPIPGAPAPAAGDPGAQATVAAFVALLQASAEPDRSASIADVDPEAPHRARLARLEEERARWEAVDRGRLPDSLQAEYDIFGRLNRDRIGELRYRAHLMPFTTFVPFYATFPQIAEDADLSSVAAAERYVARLAEWNGRIRETVALMRRGLEAGITIPRGIVAPIPGEISVHVVDDPEESRLWAPLEALGPRIPEAEAARLRAGARAAIDTSVVAGYRAFRDFLAREYVPGTRTSIGISEIPEGRAFYEHRVRQATTLDVTAEEVHRRGLAEVARIRGEMQRVVDETGFEGDFAAFVEHLRTDPRFYARTPEELLMRSAWVLKRMEGQLPRLFGRLPRTPYGIREIPAWSAPRMTTAYYSGAGAGETDAGWYYINTHDLTGRPLYEIQALSFHEAVPGHHLQRAIQRELPGVPSYRRGASFTAYTEGWALYAERLGLEVGFYDDPYDDFGRLSYEMWRALRLVVDTGIHAFGWSRQRAIDFMAANSALSLTNITSEVDRYISWPGQALGYKMGELVIRDLRARAEERLAERFDLRAFHDTVLGTGPVPLAVLESEVDAWIEGRADGG